MKESDFWSQLEYRVCHEFDEIEECRKRGLWCDGFIPERYFLDEPAPYISGRVWIGIGSRKQQEWEFILVITKRVGSVEEIDWSELLPLKDNSQWIQVDLERKRLDMNPAPCV